MTQSSAGSKPSEFIAPSTAPVLDTPTGSLPEKPAVSDAQLRERAGMLAREWEMAPSSIKQDGFTERLERLEVRLSGLLQKCRAIATPQELTPQLELLESSRMMESVIVAGKSASGTFSSLPHVRVETEGKLPRVMNLAEDICRLPLASGRRNLSQFMCSRSRRAIRCCSPK